MIDYTKSVSRMTPEMRMREVPYLVVKVLWGARVQQRVDESEEVGVVTHCGDVTRLHVDDLRFVTDVASEVRGEFMEPNGIGALDVGSAMEVHRVANDKVRRWFLESDSGKRVRVACLKDRTGSGYWRMVVPAGLISDRFFMDLTEVGMSFRQLLDYDVIFMQRNHTWQEYYLVDRLKSAGKRVVYDIDDDIFHIPPHNTEAYHRIGEDEQAAARAIMKMADVVTTPSEYIRQTFGFADKTVVIPNAVDLDDSWPSADRLGSPESSIRRILWQGSSSHSQDWLLFLPVLDALMKRYNEERRGKPFGVRLVILGYLPPVVQQYVETKPWWSGHVEYQPFREVETYLSTVRSLRADVGIAPLEDIPFNHAKSPLKFIEYAAIGVPTVASAVAPYTGVVNHGVSGFLASDSQGAFDSIDYALNFDEDDRTAMVGAARKVVDESFDAKKVVRRWEEVLSS